MSKETCAVACPWQQRLSDGAKEHEIKHMLRRWPDLPAKPVR